ncbi:uncharacterized protein EAE98_007625 [Botrytis deweyae]|uniref:Band 7 domain-containing protein n=1 Tax=Botrytis deweyae TaxID=2478750 RepID=A0ABQ7IGT2_9HELO|nr:uncharacterized protein EAE98_007625 [Botrytis deweyae]KAF7923807.1 hypothetical protein EAE98_007625 [Botrytis deweyae]
MTSSSPFWENIFLSVRAASRLFAASSTGLIISVIVLYYLSKSNADGLDLEPFKDPTFVAILLVAHFCGYLKLPDISLASDSPEASRPKTSGTNFVFCGAILYLLHTLRLNLVDLDPFHNPALLIGLVFAYTKGYLRFPESSSAEENPEVSEFKKSLPAIEAVATRLAPYVKSESSKFLLAVTHAVAADLSRITIAASSTSEFASKVSEYDKQLFEAAKTAKRDSLKATAIRITDFFVCGTTAWASFAEITEGARRITSKTNAIVEAATNVEDAEKPDHAPGDDDGEDEEDESQTQKLSRELREHAEVTSAKVEDVLLRVEAAQAKVRECDNARKQDIAARAIAEKYATAASDAVVRLDISLTDSLNESLAVVAAAERARILADQAITSATYGEMATARGTAASVRTEAFTAELSVERGRRAMDTARAILLGWLQGK